MASVPNSFLSSVSSTQHSITHMIPDGATLIIEVSGNPYDVGLLFLMLVPFNGHPYSLMVHPRANPNK
jgi:hypothetical protein